MKILKIKIYNLNSLRGLFELDFTKPPLSMTGLFAITGDTGAGKTTVLDAITLGLYGSIARSKEVKEVMSYETGECFAEVEFEHKGGTYRSKWSMRRSYGKPDGNLQQPKREFAKWNETAKDFNIVAERISEVNAAVEEVTGLDYDRFRRSVLLAQGDFAAFLDANVGERSDLLERITGQEIYTQLSIAAFRRAKEEQEAYQLLEQKLDALDILSPETVKELKEKYKKEEQASSELNKELSRIRQQLELFQQQKQLQNKSTERQEQLERLEEKALNLVPELDRLLRSEQTRPFREKLVLLNDQEERLESLQTAAEKIRRQLEQFQAHQRQLTNEQGQLKKTSDELSFFRKEKEPVWQKTIELDLKIKGQETPLRRREKELEQQETKRQEIQQLRQQKEKAKEQANDKKITAKQWLEEHYYLEALPEVLPELRTHINLWQNAQQEVADVQEQVAVAAQQFQELQKEEQTLKESLQQQRNQFEQQLAAFKQQSPDSYVADRADLLDKLANEIQLLSGQQGQIRELLQLTRDYEKLLERQNQWEEQLQEVRDQIDLTDKELLNKLNLEDALNLQLTYKRQVYEQQQLIANYEKDRSRLKEGEECPLCFSTEQPFRTKNFTPFVDRALQEFKKTERQLKQTIEDRKHIAHRQGQLSASLDRLKSSQEEMENRTDTYEERIAAMSKQLKNLQLLHHRSDQLGAYLEEKSGSLEEKKYQREALRKLDTELRQLEQAKIKQEQQQIRLTAQHDRLKDRINTMTQRQTQQAELAAAEQQKAANLLASLKTTADIEQPQQQLLKLEGLKNQWVQQEKHLQQAERQLDVLETELRELSRQETVFRKEIKEKQHMLESDRALLNELKEERKELLGAEDPVHVREQTESRLQQLLDRLQIAQQSLQEAVVQTETAASRLQSNEKEQQQLQQAITQQRTALQPKLAAAGFAGVGAVQQAILTEAAEQTIRDKKDRLERERTELRQLVKDTNEQLELLARQLEILPTEETLRKEVSEKEQRYRELLQSLGGLREQLQQHERRKKQSAALLEQMEKQGAERNKWAKLNEIIGSADGKKFRSFAQGLSLYRLCQLANIHLEQLNGRYIIQKVASEDLELQIIDTFQANNTRSMQTLSGGERFLVSLALALGLSDLAGRRTRIQSLFIDEGFGTLDEHSLDMAIATLENLQSGGKTIGLISHVRELKERIGTRIQLHKQSNGFSTLELIE